MKYKILLALFVIALATSIVLSSIPESQICDPTKGCDVVQHSSYSTTFGIKNSYFGIIIFAIGSLLIYSQIKRPTSKKRSLIHAMVIIGSVFALYLIYIQEFILNAYCKYCMIIDLGLLAALLVLIFNWRK
jgi:uncharacterized membrane protein